MARAMIGGLFGGLALYLVGFLFWGTPLANLAFKGLDDERSAALQAALAQYLTESGTGTYAVPWAGSGQGTILYGKGPIATIHFTTSGFPVVDTVALVWGLIFALITGLVISAALFGIANRVAAFADRARVAVLFAFAATFYLQLGQPVFNHYGWGYFIYLFVSDFIGLSLAGIVVARWFLPRPVASVE
ncbi:MAG: hypothetical protein AB7L36_09945 [Sphingomonadaceae bacterium]